MSVSKRERLFTLAGFLVENVALDGDGVLDSARSTSASASCPCCGRCSRRVHSRYQRRLADLPAHGRRVEMVVTIRRFYCADATCERRIFAGGWTPVLRRCAAGEPSASTASFTTLGSRSEGGQRRLSRGGCFCR